jgi:hypothetical protein
MSLEPEYNKLFLACFKAQNPQLVEIFRQKILCLGHVILFSEEPNLVARYFLEQQQYNNTPYVSVPRVINANIDGEYMDVEFFECGSGGGGGGGGGGINSHLEFDMNAYPKTKVFYILEKVVQPMIETLDVGKVMDETRQEKKKIIFLRNFDMLLRVSSDDKIINKVVNWLEKYASTTNFLFAFQMGFGQLSKEICQYALPIRAHQVVNGDAVEDLILHWAPLKKKVPDQSITRQQLLARPMVSFAGFRYFMRHLMDPTYYDTLHVLLTELLSSASTDMQKQKLLKIRSFILEWLQEGKTHNEMLKEILFYVSVKGPVEQRVYFVQELADRAKYIEQSKKIIYHLEYVLATFLL